MRVNRSVLQWKQRSGLLTRYAFVFAFLVGTSTRRAPIYAATLCGPPIICSQTGRDTEDGDDLIWAERSHRQREQH
jgi:hypothetical protein